MIEDLFCLYGGNHLLAMRGLLQFEICPHAEADLGEARYGPSRDDIVLHQLSISFLLLLPFRNSTVQYAHDHICSHSQLNGSCGNGPWWHGPRWSRRQSNVQHECMSMPSPALSYRTLNLTSPLLVDALHLGCDQPLYCLSVVACPQHAGLAALPPRRRRHRGRLRGPASPVAALRALGVQEPE